MKSAGPTPISGREVHTREQLLHLLTEAAEFEHNLLCCYLYAAFSLKRGNAGGLSDGEAGAVERWRASIMAVAIEEMTHLALVANLAVAVGGRPHFNRPNLPVAPGYHPADIVIELAPFDPETLDHFIFLERPGDVALPDAPAFDADADYGRGARHGAALMPAAHDYSTIAEFYDTIRGALSALTGRLGNERLFVGPPALQVASEVMKLPGLIAITDLTSALQALDTIVIQGEGASAQSDDSHFARFADIKTEYAALLEANESFRPAWPCARNPVMRAPPENAERVHVNHSHAAAVLDLGNALYNHMLRLLGQAYARADQALSTQRELIGAAMGVMGTVRAVGEYLATLPAGKDAESPNAGMTFAMFRATETLAGTSSELHILSERFGELCRGMRAISETVPELLTAAHRLSDLAERFARGAGPTS